MIIDEREPNSVKYYDWDCDVQVEQVNSADFIIGDALVGIERKDISTGDLVNSIKNHLWSQLDNMMDNFDVSVLMITGTISDLPTRQMSGKNIEAIYGALARIALSYDVSVFWFREKSQMFKEIQKLEAKADTDAGEIKPHLTKRNMADERINVLYGIPGIGRKTAQNLVDEFGSIANICSKSSHELAAADGVGEKTGKKIHDILHNGNGEGNSLI